MESIIILGGLLSLFIFRVPVAFAPKWLTHGSVWFGFALISLQAFAELYKLWSNEKQTDTITKGVH